MSHGIVANRERECKEAYPEGFCVTRSCLWRLSSGPCPKHGRAGKSEATTQAAYEADLARAPSYPDGSPRARWGELSTDARWSWARPEAESDLEMARRRA
jgi:hypothetical protein